MPIPQYIVDAFVGNGLTGNPAAVCMLNDWPEDAWLLGVAQENGLSETAFLVREGMAYRLRWFTPAAEVKLCGHATLATAHVLYAHGGETAPWLSFTTLSGVLTVARVGEHEYRLDFPARPATLIEAPPAVAVALGATPVAVWETDVYMAVFEREAQIRALSPDMTALLALPRRAVIATAPGLEADFVSRYFAPRMGVPEDPVTGSAHCVLTPYWGARLGKRSLLAHQLSERGGELWCDWEGERVGLRGRAVTASRGERHAPGE